MKPFFEIFKNLGGYVINHSLFCQHNYELVNQFEMVSQFDIVASYGLVPKSWNITKRRIVTDYKCKKCNKIKRLQVVTPN